MRERWPHWEFSSTNQEVERGGQVWQQIATNLNGYPNFSVAFRAVRERFTAIMRKYKVKMRK